MPGGSASRAGCANKRKAGTDAGVPAFDIPHDDEEAEEPPTAARPPAAKRRKSKGKAAPEADEPKQGHDAEAGPSTAQQDGGRGSARGARVERLHMDRDELKSMNEKISEYQEREEQAREKHQAAIGLSTPELDALVAKVVRAMLFKAHQKPGLPVKRDELVDIIKADYKEHKQHKRMPALVIPMAQHKMISVFGVELRELRRTVASNPGNRKAKAPDAEASSSMTYVLRSVVPTALRRALVHDPREDVSRALLMVVLSLIQLNGDKMDADELWRHLRQLAVPREDPHPVLGSVKAWLEGMEKTRYLIKTTHNGPNGPEHTYEWGENATDEIGKRAVKEFAEQGFSKCAALGDLGETANMDDGDDPDDDE